MLLSVENILLTPPTTLHSYLSTNVSSSGTALPVRNINGFTANFAVQVGRTGEEQSEISVVSTPSGTILPLPYSSLTYSHNQDTPVYQIHYDKIIFKRSTVGTSGTATSISTVSITPDSLYTNYDDTSGAASYAYRTQYYNSISGDLSAESDWFTSSGPNVYALSKMRQRIKDALYNSGFLTDDSIITDWINEWLDEMTNSAIKVNQSYSIGTANYSFGTAGLGTVTDSTFKQPIKVEVTFDGTNYSNSLEIPINEWSTTDFYSIPNPRHYWAGDTVFGILPYGNVGTAHITFAKRNTPLVNDADELPFTLRSYTTSCINYCLYRAHDKDQHFDQADKFYNKYLLSQRGFVADMTPRDQTGPKFITFLDNLSEREDSYFNF